MFQRATMIALTLAATLLGQACAHAGELTLFSKENFNGRELTLREVTPNLVDYGFNDKASSMIVRSGRWEVCVDSEFRGYCQVFERGEYRDLQRFNNNISSAREVGTGRDRRDWRQHQGRRGMMELFSQPGLGGNSTRLVYDNNDFVQIGFNDRAVSVLVEEGNWQLCSDADYRGTCRVFGPGRYNDLGYGLAGKVSSARMIDAEPPRPLPVPVPPPPPRVENAPVVLYAEEGMRGRAVALRGDANDFVGLNFNDAAISMVIQNGNWEFCTDSYFRGQCRVMGPGQYRLLEPFLQRSISSARQVNVPSGPARGDSDVELFSGTDFSGGRISLRRDVRTLTELDFNDRAGSIIVHYGSWEFCTHADFGGPCVTYGPGRYGSLGSMNNQISSLRRVR